MNRINTIFNFPVYSVETIDGQIFLTVIFIIHSWIRHHYFDNLRDFRPVGMDYPLPFSDCQNDSSLQTFNFFIYECRTC